MHVVVETSALISKYFSPLNTSIQIVIVSISLVLIPLVTIIYLISQSLVLNHHHHMLATIPVVHGTYSIL